MSQNTSQPPAGWYPDPAGADAERFWDGVAWSQATRDRPRPPAESAQPAGSGSGPGAAGYGPQNYGQHGYGSRVQQGFAPYEGYATAGPQYAGFWWRVLGKIVDNVIVSTLYYVVAAATGLTGLVTAHVDRWMRELLIWSENPESAVPDVPEGMVEVLALSLFIGFVLSAVYRTVMYGTLSATAGQLAAGLRVVKDGAPVESKLTWGTAVNRGVLGGLIWEVLGWVNGLVAAFSRKKQTLGDMLAKTVVYKVR